MPQDETTVDETMVPHTQPTSAPHIPPPHLAHDLATLANPMRPAYEQPTYTAAWQDAKLDPELPGPLYSADQIRIPPQLVDVMRDFTKAAIREQPAADDIYEWSRNWFQQRVDRKVQGAAA